MTDILAAVTDCDTDRSVRRVADAVARLTNAQVWRLELAGLKNHEHAIPQLLRETARPKRPVLWPSHGSVRPRRSRRDRAACFDATTAPRFWDQAAHARRELEEEFMARYRPVTGARRTIADASIPGDAGAAGSA